MGVQIYSEAQQSATPFDLAAAYVSNSKPVYFLGKHASALGVQICMHWNTMGIFRKENVEARFALSVVLLI